MAGALRDALASLPADDPGDAATHPAPWAAAAGGAERLGMVPFTEWIRQLRARFPAAAAAGSPLSPRELGLRNRSQIAAWASASEAPPAPPTRA